MKTWALLTGAGAAAFSLVIGVACHADGQYVPPQGPDHHHIEYICQSLLSQDCIVGKTYVHVLRGDVKMGWTDGGPMPLTIGPDEMTLDDPQESTFFHIPMDRATLQVTVTSAGTVFEDKQGHRLSVVTQAPPNLSYLPINIGTPIKM